MANIYTAINAVMNDCGAVGKNSKNPQQGYLYRGIDAVMNAINPALTKNKVFVSPEVLEQSREERVNSKGTLLIYSIVKVKYTFFAEDGSSVSAVVVGEGMDSGDKATNKAMSAAFKYALFQTFCIPTEEMIDSEIDSPEPAPKKKPEKPAEKKPEVQQLVKRKYPADMITPDEANNLARELQRMNVNIDMLLQREQVTKLIDLKPEQYMKIMGQIDAAKREKEQSDSGTGSGGPGSGDGVRTGAKTA